MLCSTARASKRADDGTEWLGGCFVLQCTASCRVVVCIYHERTCGVRRRSFTRSVSVSLEALHRRSARQLQHLPPARKRPIAQTQRRRDSGHVAGSVSSPHCRLRRPTFTHSYDDAAVENDERDDELTKETGDVRLISFWPPRAGV